nr:PaREP1 family protein [Caldivirga sp. UBA161]
MSIAIPKKLYDEATRRGIDVEELVLSTLINTLKLDPETLIKIRIELAIGYLNEGKNLIDKDPVQASEKLYKAAEESVKALVVYYDLKDILARVNERGRWTVTELEKAVIEISRRLGRWFRQSWDTANYLHVWGFHEMKLDADDIKDRLPDVERMIQEAQKLLGNNS